MVQMAGLRRGAPGGSTLTVGSAFEIPFVLARRGRRRDASRCSAEAPRARVGAQPDRRHGRRRPRSQSLPLNGRNFLDLALLAPGVSPPNIASTQLFAETSAVPGVGLSVGSQRNLSNSFIVDGLSANDDAAGLSGMPYGVDAVEQFQVVTSGGQAELGRALGGYVNVVTSSGTNQLRGTAYGYFRDDALQRRQRALGHDAADVAAAVRRAASAGRSRATARSTSPTSSSALLDQTGLTTISDGQRRRRSTRGWPPIGYPGRAIATGIYPNPVRQR